MPARNDRRKVVPQQQLEFELLGRRLVEGNNGEINLALSQTIEVAAVKVILQRDFDVRPAFVEFGNPGFREYNRATPLPG